MTDTHQAIDRMELAGHITVADMTMHFGIEDGSAAYEIELADPSLDASVRTVSERVLVPPHVFCAIINLFLFGDDTPQARQYYAVITNAHLPADFAFRPIP